MFLISFFGGMLAELALLLAFTVKTEQVRLLALVLPRLITLQLGKQPSGVSLQGPSC